MRRLTIKILPILVAHFLSASLIIASSDSSYASTSTIKKAFQSESVLKRKQIQYALKKLNFYNSTIDALYGPGTEKALMGFASVKGLNKSSPHEIFSIVLNQFSVPSSFSVAKRLSSSNQTTNTAVALQPLVQPIPAGVNYSFYPTSDFVNLTIPEDFKYIDSKKLKYHMQSGEYRAFSKQWVGVKKRYYGWDCHNILKEFRVNLNFNSFKMGDDESFFKITVCQNHIGPMTHLDYEYMLGQMSDIILHHATHRNVREPYHVKDVNNPQYAKYQLMAKTAEFYAVFKNLMPLTPINKVLITEYFDEIFMGNPFHTQEQKPQCDVNNPSRIATVDHSRMGLNGCGSWAFNMVNSALAYSISTSNNRLFKQAKMNLTHLLGSFDDNGIQVSQATRGGVSWGYHTDVTIQLGYTTEILASIGYDFLQHTMPRSGIKVKDVMDMHWAIVNDHTLLGVYAKYNKGVMKRDQWNDVKHLSTFKTTQIQQQQKPWRHIALSNPRYINEYVEAPTTIWGKEVNLKSIANSKIGGANNWYTQAFPTEYLYYMNNER
jgi:hypothetical protein